MQTPFIMGWFDDSDDDEDQRRQEIGSPGGDLGTNTEQAGEIDEEDPLDAYMKTLDKAASKSDNNDKNTSENDASDSRKGDTNATSMSGGRLDVENEEEATSHWVNKNNNENISSCSDVQGKSDGFKHDTSTCTDNSRRAIAYRALNSTFQRASDQQQQKYQQGNVDIQLQQVQHDQMKYAQFYKCLLPMSRQVAKHENDKNESYTNTTIRNTPEGERWRKDNDVTCQPPTLDPIYDFLELRDVLPEEVLAWNAIKNLTRPTPVQSQTLGVALCGQDAIVTASTGSGKTLSYLWPIASQLMANYCNTNSSSSRALVLVPTRELALQVEQIARSMFAKLPLTALAITGGNMGRYQLSQKLAGTKPHCVIATPGRLLDVFSAQQKSKQEWLLPNITFLVMDEADKMIQMGFANQVTQILQILRPDRQSLLVSATFDSRLQQRCQEWMHDPFRISVGKTGESSKHVTQHVICLQNARAKMEFLKESLPTFAAVGRTLVFSATRQGVEDVAADLRTVLPVETLHGDRHLTDRKAALKAFTKGDIKVLVATDVAGRGLDIPEVSTVINFDPAKNWDTHVHRIGRAGRLLAKEQQQQKGSAYTLLLPSNVDFAKSMIQAYKREGRLIPPEVQKFAANKNYHSKRQDRGSSTFEGGVNLMNSSVISHSERYRSGDRTNRLQQNDTTKNYYGPSTKRSRF